METIARISVLPLASRDVERVWGGQRLAPGAPQPVGERWLAYDENPVSGGPFAGRRLAEALDNGVAILRRSGERLAGPRRPGRIGPFERPRERASSAVRPWTF